MRACHTGCNRLRRHHRRRRRMSYLAGQARHGGPVKILSSQALLRRNGRWGGRRVACGRGRRQGRRQQRRREAGQRRGPRGGLRSRPRRWVCRNGRRERRKLAEAPCLHDFDERSFRRVTLRGAVVVVVDRAVAGHRFQRPVDPGAEQVGHFICTTCDGCPVALLKGFSAEVFRNEPFEVVLNAVSKTQKVHPGFVARRSFQITLVVSQGQALAE